DATALPRAADVARLGMSLFEREAVPPERLEPAYLRDNVALTLAEQAAKRLYERPLAAIARKARSHGSRLIGKTHRSRRGRGCAGTAAATRGRCGRSCGR